LWIGDNETGGVSDADLKATLDQIEPENPEDIVVLIHGFETSREESLAQYKILAPRIKEQFAKNGGPVAVVGVQWDSKAGGFILTLPWAYLDKAELAMKVGRMGVRQLLFALKERFPEARLTLLGHSMGCEVSGGALRPDWGDEAQPETVFKPGEPIPMHGVVLLGSDLDYDAAYKGGVSATQAPPKLLWMTMSRVTVSRFEKDRVLQLRSLFRGKASGAAFPRMTEQQYDYLIKNRVVVFDNTDIPPTHHFLSYADETRLAQIAHALMYKAGKASEPEMFQEMDQVLDGPGGVDGLTPWFAQPDLTPHIYALWRLEHEKCGGSTHLTDETLSEVARLVRPRPRQIRHLQANSRCVNLKDKNWPSQLVLDQFGAPEWSPMGGNTWIRYFRGEVTEVSDSSLTLKTDQFGMEMSFDTEETRTRFTPGFEAVKVGSKVEIAVDGPDVESVSVLPFSVWLSKQTR
jgi:esterase/lipase superfamily enzyme